MNAAGSSLTEFPYTPRVPEVGPSVHRCALAGLLVFAGSMGAPSAARAEPSADESALATLLFQQGRALIAEGQVPAACQKFAESQRLDPSGGTLLNLARCHEQEGRLASAWSEFKVAETVARDGGRSDREAEAAFHISALEPRLSRLSIVVPAAADVAGLVVERDGRELGRGAWSTAIPIDGGEHVVRATAPGRQPFTATIVIGSELDRKTVEVPILATPVTPMTRPSVASPAVSPAASPPMATAVPLAEAETFTPARLRGLGIGSAALGVVAWAAGGYALATALEAKHAAAADCWVDGCGEVGLRKHRQAVSRGKVATALGIGGAVLVGTGVTLFYFGERSSSRLGEARVPTRFVVSAAPGAVMTTLAGDL
jgi:serine/threonine-protein kinase